MRIAIAMLVVLLAPALAHADPPHAARGVWLVPTTLCIAGGASAGATRTEVRVQLGAFDNHFNANAWVARLRRHGVAAEVWLAPDLSDDDDRLLVVSRARFRSMSAARQQVRAIRRRGLDAFVRAFAFSIA